MRLYVSTKLTPNSDPSEMECDTLDEAMDLWRACRDAGDYDTRMYYRTAA